MKAGSKQRRAAAGSAAQGRSLPARDGRPAPFLLTGNCGKTARNKAHCFPMSSVLFCLLPLSMVPAAGATEPVTPPPHYSQPKPSAVHPVAPQAPTPQPAPARAVSAPQSSHAGLPANRGYAPGHPGPSAQHAPSSYSYGYNRPGAMPSQPVRQGPYLQPNSAYGTLQAQNNARQPFAPSSQQPRLTAQVGNGASGEHLGSWMKQHQNQSLPDQERSLRQEPGFDRLAPQQQQNLVNHLHQLNQMPAEQRQRTLNRIENMEHLTPERRQAVRSSAQQLGALPEDRKRLVKKAFRDLRDLPPEQRQSLMNSPQFAGQFSAQERSIMGNLLVVEPYQHPGETPQQQNGR